MKNIVFEFSPSFVQIPAQSIGYVNALGKSVVECIAADDFVIPTDCPVKYEAKWDGKAPYVEVLRGTASEVHAFAGWPTLSKVEYDLAQAALKPK